MRKLKIDYDKLNEYFSRNNHKPIYAVYHELKHKKVKNMTNEEILVYSYLKLNKRKLGIK